MTVASSGVSMELTMRRAPRFGDLLAGFLMNSNVALTSVAVSARPSWKPPPGRIWVTEVNGAGADQHSARSPLKFISLSRSNRTLKEHPPVASDYRSVAQCV